METASDTTQGDTFDLDEISRACRVLIDWYDEQLAGGAPTIDGLQEVLTQLAVLPRLPGRLGRDIEVVLSGGTDHSRNELIGTIERLRLVAIREAVGVGPVDLDGVA